MKASEVTSQSFETVPGREPEVADGSGGAEQQELALCGTTEIRR
jgi:hypothetical protein